MIGGGVLAESGLAVLDAQQSLGGGGNGRAAGQIGGGDEHVRQAVEVVHAAVRKMQTNRAVQFDMRISCDEPQRFHGDFRSEQASQTGFKGPLVTFEFF